MAGRRDPTPREAALALESPWLTAREAAAYVHRHYETILHEMRVGRLRHAVVSDSNRRLTTKAWCDEWVTRRAALVEVAPRPTVGRERWGKG